MEAEFEDEIAEVIQAAEAEAARLNALIVFAEQNAAKQLIKSNRTI